MKKRRDTLSLGSLELAPAQVCGGIRIVPLLRRGAPGDLRLLARRYDDQAMVVSLDGEPLAPGIKYISYVPHGLVMRWTDDGAPVAAFGTGLGVRDGKQFKGCGVSVRVAHRMVRREDKHQLRFLPMHLAMEGYLAHHFNGPDIAWAEYSKRGIRRGLDPRAEDAVPGSAILGLEDALRVFEIHRDQVGVLLFVADALASVMVVSHPDDYRALHRTLLEDFYGELMYQYALYASEQPISTSIDDRGVSTLAELRGALQNMRGEWAAFHGSMAAGLLGTEARVENVYIAGKFRLQRFMPELDPAGENHIGERILRDDGTLEYLKTYRLSAAQTKRAYLLSVLAKNNWNLDATAASFGQAKNDLLIRIDKAGFGYLIADHVLAAARKRR
jgi:hypothetical protein